MRLLKYFKTSLAVRTASIILAMVAAVGIVFLLLAAQVTRMEEHDKQIQRLNGLLDTVQNTARIAAFLHDAELASEVVSGLLQNSTVRGVRIWADGDLIAEDVKQSSDSQPAGDAIVREIRSPFGDEVVGRIALVPDRSEIQAEVARAAGFTSLLLTVLLVLIGAGIVLVVIHMITRPILQISNRLHGLRAETGEKLDFPRGSETDEIGRLVNDVNALIDHLVNILREERDLRIAREIAEKKFRTIFESAETGIFVVDENDYLASYNPAFKRLFGLPPTASPDDDPTTLAALFRHGPRDQDVEAFVHRCRKASGPQTADFLLADGRGAERWVHVVLNPVQGSNLQGVVNDVTQRKLSEEAAKTLAVTDSLTGLNNRLGFERRLEKLIELCRREPAHRFSLLMLDLDHFKEANDTYGHEAGDAVLKRVADLLREKTRKTDFIARLGGDEFMVLLDGTTEREAIETIVETLLKELNAPVPLGDGNQVRVGASIGIALYGTDTTIQSDLVRRADEAMYRAKLAGRNTYRFYRDLHQEPSA